MTEAQQYDVIVVGGGSAGCAMAARLSENPSRRVLLIEAGHDYATLEDFPQEVTFARSLASSFPGHPRNWSFVVQLLPDRRYPVARGKIIGGSSSVNGTYFVRGRPEDFDGWAAKGLDLWSYKQVLPYFRKCETDTNFDNEYHGQDGPIPVRRPMGEELRPISRAFVEACRAAGFSDEPDKNAPGPSGVGPTPRNVRDGYRINTAIGYLTEARKRPNLTIQADSLARRVLFEGKKAAGVEYERNGRIETVRGEQVVLCAGGFKSPHLLMLSGVGPAEMLRKHGVEVIHDNPNVGRHVKDHPSLHVTYRARGDTSKLPVNFMSFQSTLNHTAPGSDDVSDLQITCGSATFNQMFRSVSDGIFGWLPSYIRRPFKTLNALRKLPLKVVIAQARSQDNMMLLCSLEHEKSTGSITLASGDPTVHPNIDFNYLSHPDDLPRIQHNLRTAVGLLKSPPFKDLKLKIIAPTDQDLATDAALEKWIRGNMGTSFHTCCSTKMGLPSDPTAVVDQRGRVYGVEGLRIADLSILPDITRRGPAATAVMIGERVAALIDEEN